MARVAKEQCPINFPTGAANPLPFFRYPQSVMVTQPKCPNPPPSCGVPGCGAQWDTSTGIAACRGSGDLQDCRCTPDKGLCGEASLCNVHNCSGGLDLATGTFICKNWWKPCECLGTDQLCGAKQSCLDGGCGGKVPQRRPAGHVPGQAERLQVPALAQHVPGEGQL